MSSVPLPPPRQVLSTVSLALRAHGASFVLGRCAEYAVSPITWLLVKSLRSGRRFTCAGEEYSYFYHPYNLTWTNERCVEVPIVRRHVLEHAGKRILEVGNVLSWYFAITHDVVDKYERGSRNVLNADVADLRTPVKYDLIVSISTLEHVGWDDTPRDPEKLFRAVRTLKTLLTDGGKMVLTFPVGYNPVLDAHLGKGAFGFSAVTYLRRTSKQNTWTSASWDEVKGARYGHPYRGANAIAIAIGR